MFRHMLVPTDGSPLSDKTVKRAVSIAKEAKVQLTFFFAAEDRAASLLRDESLLLAIDPQLVANATNNKIKKVLGKAQAEAEAAGVPCQVLSAVSNEPYEAIIDAAKKSGCDLILMASNGYRGVKGLLLGSQTQKVLTHSDIPVLVYR
ncbi:MAG: universal stress protein [Sterolibacterium sp.]|nr:universal stress protein [Sterolibacterium sp.]